MKKSPLIVEISNVDFAYNDVLVLQNVSLPIFQGDFVGCIGPNGSGKTTLMKILLGLLKPTRGTVTLFGAPIERFRDWRKIGYVPQKMNGLTTSFPMTVEEVVGMNGGSRSQIGNALRAVGMLDQRRIPLSRLSGGQQQRVFIARGLVTDPELLILDEPTVGVDVDSQVRFYALLRELNEKKHLTLILVSHDIDVVAHEVKTIACINTRLVCHGEPQSVLKGDFVKKMYGKHFKYIVHGH